MKSALRPGGLLIMIVHLADADQPQGTPTRAYPGELRAFFEGWRILHYREGEPGEPCHRHAVAELVAQKPDATERDLWRWERGRGGALDGTGPRGWIRVASQRASISSSASTNHAYRYDSAWTLFVDRGSANRKDSRPSTG